MNTPILGNPTPAAEEQAALWAAKIDGSELSKAELAELDIWLNADESHRALLSEYCELEGKLDVLAPALLASGVISKPVVSKPSFLSWRTGWFSAAALASCTALVAVGVWALRPSDPKPESFATPIAQRQTITLEDGTSVELNAGTRILVEHSAKERRVRLLEGQAFFVVSKNKEHPFFVDTNTGSIRVTGTSFDVNAYTSDSLEVTVLEGSVQVNVHQPNGAASQETRALKAGDRLSSTPAGVSMTALSTKQLRDQLAWRDGMIVFNNTPLTEAFSAYGRYHGLKVSCDSGAAERKVGGRYNIQDLESFISSIQGSFPVQVQTYHDGRLVVTLRASPRNEP